VKKNYKIWIIPPSSVHPLRRGNNPDFLSFAHKKLGPHTQECKLILVRQKRGYSVKTK